MIPQRPLTKTPTKANAPIKALALPKVTAKGPVYFERTDFPFGANAPHDTQDPQDSQDIHESHDRHDPHGQSLTINVGNASTSDFLLNLPLEEYLREVLRFSERLRDELNPARWQSPLFTFARFCKSHSSMSGLRSHEAMRRVGETMSQWPDLPANADPWEYFFPDATDSNAAQVDFMNSWELARSVPFKDTLGRALRMATERPLDITLDRGPLYPRFVSLAAWLQTLQGELPIMLPTRTIASLLGCDARTISTLRRWAILEGLLTETKRFSFRSGGKSEATEFRFAVERFQCLRDAA